MYTFVKNLIVLCCVTMSIVVVSDNGNLRGQSKKFSSCSPYYGQLTNDKNWLSTVQCFFGDECCDSCCEGPRGPKGDKGDQGPQGEQGPAGPAQSKDYLVFTAFDMNKAGNNPDTSFNKIYPDSHFQLNVWKLQESAVSNQEVYLLFGLPHNYKPAGCMVLTLYLFAANNNQDAGSVAKIRVRSDSKGNYAELGADFLATDYTQNFSVVEPIDPKHLESIIVTTTITTADILPDQMMLLVFDRVAPTQPGLEYEKDIYLYSAVLSYETN